MLVQLTVFALYCDKCNMAYENGEGYVPHYYDRDEFNDVKESLIEEDEWAFIGDKAYCPRCRKPE